jgi:predicted phosphodiesterase
MVWCRNVASFGCAFSSKNSIISSSVKSNFITAAQSFQPGIPRRESTILRNSIGSSVNSFGRPVSDIENIYVISDLHTDKIENLDWLKERCKNRRMQQTPGQNDALIIAGDISHALSKIEETFSIIKDELSCHVFFIWGNHEAWTGGQEMDSLGIESSLEKIVAVKELCKKMGVRTEFELVGNSYQNPVCILPIESWYDGTLALEGCEDLCSKFSSWPWVDFIRCEWPDQDSLMQWCLSEDNASFSILDKGVENTGRIPLGLTNWFALKNNKSISAAKEIYNDWIDAAKQVNGEVIEMRSAGERLPGLITYSHFLPNKVTLPDWKDPHCEVFQRDEWLDHPVPEVSAKFAKVRGSVLIDEQIRSILPSVSDTDDLLRSVQHLHIFGHSHRPKDFVYNGIRYVHNPLGKPAERAMNMISNEVDFQLVWDCTKSLSKPVSDVPEYMSYSGGIGVGEVPGERVIRFWEEKGGGLKSLSRNMKHRRQRKKLAFKRLCRDKKENP